MTAHWGEEGYAVRCGEEIAPENSGSQVPFDRRPGGLNPLVAIKGIFAGDALAPAIDPFTQHTHQQDATAVGAPKTRLKKMNKRELYFDQFDRFDLHDKDKG